MIGFEAIAFFIFLLFCIFLLRIRQHKKELITTANDRATSFILLKKAIPLIFTPFKLFVLFLFLMSALFLFNLKEVKVASYFPVSLTALSLLLTTSNISNNLSNQSNLKKLSKEAHEAYLGRILLAAIIWLIINIFSFCVPLLPLNELAPDFERGLTLFFLQLFCLGILLIFDLLVSTIKIYRYTEPRQQSKQQEQKQRHQQQIKKWGSSKKTK
ncbi:hypothetical protein [Vagococcus sp.]|uniref:hypothetical protein n=1 Tax=Vagococcus sp. TaxID=1933889 RepID=UPI003F9B9833